MSVMLPEREHQNIVETAKQYYQHLAYQSGLSLRSIEKILSAFSTSVAYRPKDIFCPDVIMIGLCALKVVSPDVYARAKSGIKIFNVARDPLALAIVPEEREKHAIEHFAKVWRFFSDPDVADDNPDYLRFAQGLSQRGFERWDVMSHVARNVVDRLQ
jgi:hypothetical protein